MSALTTSVRFWVKVDKEGPDGCWTWTACTDRDGYGRFTIEGISRYAHRVAYELARGSIPDGLVLDHLCRNRPCVNPDHLEAVTDRENRERGLRSPNNTECINGHAYTPENTYEWRGKRHCRICLRRADRKRRRTHIETGPKP